MSGDPQSSLHQSCLCTLAVHAPYRARARRLVADAPDWPWVIATDSAEDFADLPVQTIVIEPTGPMARDYIARLPPTGNNRGAAAYHDKRHALRAALAKFTSAIFLDADSRIREPLPQVALPRGLAVLPVVDRSLREHLSRVGTWRLPAFEALAQEVFGGTHVLDAARWCHETVYGVTKDGREHDFFAAWDRAAAFMTERGVLSGEGGVMGLAALAAGWPVNLSALVPLDAYITHEGGGPKAV